MIWIYYNCMRGLQSVRMCDDVLTCYLTNNHPSAEYHNDNNNRIKIIIVIRCDKVRSVTWASIARALLQAASITFAPSTTTRAEVLDKAYFLSTYVMSCCVMVWYVVMYYYALHYAMWCNTTLCYFALSHVILFYSIAIPPIITRYTLHGIHYTHLYASTHTHILTYSHTYTYTQAHTHTYTQAHTYTYTQAHTHTHT